MSRLASQRGQAMLEYSLLSWLLIVGLVLAATVQLIPGPRGPRNLIQLFFEALQAHYDSYDFLLSTGLP